MLMMPRKTPRIQTSTVYLGDQATRKDREARLDTLARSLGLKNRSVLMQRIADGDLTICPPKDKNQ